MKQQHANNNKGNRQAVKSTKSQTLLVRVTPLDKSIVKQYADRHGLSVGEYVRRKSLELKLPKIYSEEEFIYLKLLRETAHDLKRLSNLIRSKHPDTDSAIKEVVSRLKAEIQKIDVL